MRISATDRTEMYDKNKKYSVEISEDHSIYYQFSETKFRHAELRAEEFVRKGITFSASIFEGDDLIETIRWDEERCEIVYILSYYGRLCGYRLLPPQGDATPLND
jgi:hypothetical protein